MRAGVYEQAGPLPQAVAEISQALTKETALPTLYALYRFRREWRVKLGQTQEVSCGDPDCAWCSDLCTGGR